MVKSTVNYNEQNFPQSRQHSYSQQVQLESNKEGIEGKMGLRHGREYGGVIRRNNTASKQ